MRFRKVLLIVVTPLVLIGLAWWDIFLGWSSQPLKVEQWIARVKKA